MASIRVLEFTLTSSPVHSSVPVICLLFTHTLLGWTRTAPLGVTGDSVLPAFHGLFLRLRLSISFQTLSLNLHLLIVGIQGGYQGRSCFSFLDHTLLPLPPPPFSRLSSPRSLGLLTLALHRRHAAVNFYFPLLSPIAHQPFQQPAGYLH